MNKEKIDRDRGTRSAVLRSSGPKHSAERPATTLGVSGESVRRDVPADDMKPMTREEEYRNADVPMPKDEDYDGGKAYTEFLKLFFKGKKDE